MLDHNRLGCKRPQVSRILGLQPEVRL